MNGSERVASLVTNFCAPDVVVGVNCLPPMITVGGMRYTFSVTRKSTLVMVLASTAIPVLTAAANLPLWIRSV